MAEETIGEAIANASAYLKGRKATPEECELIDKAFAIYGAKRPSDDIAECAAALLKLGTN